MLSYNIIIINSCQRIIIVSIAELCAYNIVDLTALAIDYYCDLKLVLVKAIVSHYGIHADDNIIIDRIVLYKVFKAIFKCGSVLQLTMIEVCQCKNLECD